MRMRVWTLRPCEEWETVVRWFAWRPVLVGEFWVWLQTVERRDWYDEYSTYRAYSFADEDGEAEEGGS